MSPRTEHFFLAEFERSATAARLNIDNSCPRELYPNLQKTFEALEIVRLVLRAPLIITSGYRCPALNAAVNGAKYSAHMQGWAADLQAPKFGTPLRIFAALENNISMPPFDEIILELCWVHLSFAPTLRGKIIKPV